MLPLVKKRVWVCQDGRRMTVVQMDDAHLANAIAAIERSKTGWRYRWLPRLYLERGIRRLKHGKRHQVRGEDWYRADPHRTGSAFRR